MKIRYKLTLTFLAILLILGAIFYVFSHESRKSLEKNIGESEAILATQIILSIEKDIFYRIEEFEEYAGEPMLIEMIELSNERFEKMENARAYIDEMDRQWTSVPKETITPFMKEIFNSSLSQSLKKKLNYLDRHHGYEVFGEVFVTNRFGANVAQTGKTSDFRQDDEQWWQEAKQNSIFIGDVEYDDSAEIYSLAIGLPIVNKQGNFLGVMKVILSIDGIINILENAKTSSPYELTDLELISEKGTLIYSTENHILFSEVPDLFMSFLARSDYGYFKGAGDMRDEGKEVYAFAKTKGYRHLRNLNWILLIENSAKEVLSPVVRLQKRMLSAFSITLIAIFLIGFVLSENIIRRLERLGQAAKEIGKGNLDVPIEVNSADEIGELARSFNNMTDNLKSVMASRDELNKEIGERKEVEKTLRFTQLAIDGNADPVYGVKADSKICYANESGCRMLGYSQEELQLMTVPEIDPDFPPEAWSEHWQEMKDARSLIFEARHKTKSGRVFPVEVHSSFIRHKNEEYIWAYVYDITERKKIEDEMHKLSIIPEQSPNSIVVTNKDGNIEYVNPKFTEVTGYSFNEVIGKNPRILKSGKNPPELYKNLWETITAGGIWRGELHNKRKNGELYWELASISAIKNDEGEITHYLAIKEDITERKELEDTLKNAHEKLTKDEKIQKKMFNKLEKAHEEIKHAQSQLVQSEKMAAIGQLSAGIAHEINNPVGYISSNLETLEQYLISYNKLLRIIEKLKSAVEDKDMDKAVTVASQVNVVEGEINFDFINNDIDNLVKESRTGIEKIKKIVNDLRAFSREEKDSMEPASIEEIIEGVLNIVWNEIKYKVELKKDYGQMPLLRVDSQKIGQVFINILVNASQAIENKGVIEIKTYTKEERGIIEISDTGKGIPPQHLKKIFDPFFTSKPVGEGTGLGLSVSYEIIKKHKGKLTVESKLGMGTKFIIALPLPKEKT